MKTFQQFREGIFDFLPKTKYETPAQAKKRESKIDPGIIKNPKDNVQYNMPIILDKMQTPQKPGESKWNYLKRTSYKA